MPDQREFLAKQRDVGFTERANHAMQPEEYSETDYVETLLPWIVAIAGLAIYLVTLNHWVTVASLVAVSKVTGWDWWSLTLQSPLFYLLTSPIRWLPSAWQPLALNVFTAVCAAGTLGLLARSVALLPHDRTREQRQRERSEYSLLSISAAWIPPMLAALALGLQLTFWENATAATEEALNVLLFAYVARCLLEYRVDPRDGWLAKMSFIYGLSMANNYAMVGFFPLLLVAFIWMNWGKGLRYFFSSLPLKMLGWGLLGVALYLVLPWIESQSGKSTASFWDLLRAETGAQKSMLAMVPGYVLILCGLTSLLPVFVMGIRWKGSFGETSILGSALTNLMFRVVHVLFLVVCIWVVFDPPFSPRISGLGLPFLTFYYLSALAVGYYSGYVLLVFGTEPEKRRHHASAFGQTFGRILAGLVWLALLGVPAALAYKNWPTVQANNGAHLRQLASTLATSLPTKNSIILSDEPIPLLLVQAALRGTGQTPPPVVVDVRYLSYPFYHRNLARHYPTQWPGVSAEATSVSEVNIQRLLLALGKTNEIYYLNPTYSSCAESLYATPNGLVYRMKPYPAWVVTNPPMSQTEIRSNLAFWEKAKSEGAAVARSQAKAGRELVISDAEYVSRFYSRAANYLGVLLQRNGLLKEAAQCFNWALDYNPENDIASINRDFNKILGSGQIKPVEFTPTMEERFRDKYRRGWEDWLRENGPVDELRFCTQVGQKMALSEFDLSRQAAQQFARVQQLDPKDFDARIWLGNLFLKMHWPDQTLEVVTGMRSLPQAQSIDNQIEMARLEAWAYAYKTNYAKATDLLLQAQQKNPGVASLAETLSQLYARSGDFSNALAAVEQQLKIQPDNVNALLNKGAFAIEIRNYSNALPALDRVLVLDPKNDVARMNRAIALLQTQQLDAAQRDYQILLDGNPHFYKSYFGLAQIAYQHKDTAAAIANYEQYLKYAPRNTKGFPRDPAEAQYVTNRLNELRSSGR